MIDLHSHILPNVDDGSQSIEESVEMGVAAVAMGLTAIACTSHFYCGRFENENYYSSLETLKKVFKERNIGLELYLGNEIKLSTEAIEALKQNKINSYNNSKYVLLEADYDIPFTVLQKGIEQIKALEKQVVLAHVERYRGLTLKEFVKLKKTGVVFQLNMSSISNGYKSKTIKFFEYNMVDILASDAHRVEPRGYRLGEYIAKIKELVGEEKFLEMTVTNPRKVLQNEQLNAWGRKNEEKNSDSKLITKLFSFWKRDGIKRGSGKS